MGVIADSIKIKLNIYWIFLATDLKSNEKINYQLLVCRFLNGVSYFVYMFLGTASSSFVRMDESISP